jgi:hypothetical protein
MTENAESPSKKAGAGTALKKAIKDLPVLGPAALRLKGMLERRTFSSSADYWEKRYAQEGNSGAGSYGRLAAFKAEFLNAFVEKNAIKTIIEFGCGDGAQLEIAKYPSYVGVDVSETILNICRTKFAGTPQYRFCLASDEACFGGIYDLAMSLDVLYHLVEDQVFNDYLAKLFASSSRYVVVYSDNEERESFNAHVCHRKFTAHVAKNYSQWSLVEHRANPYPYDLADPDNTSFADFFVFQKNS